MTQVRRTRAITTARIENVLLARYCQQLKKFTTTGNMHLLEDAAITRKQIEAMGYSIARENETYCLQRV